MGKLRMVVRTVVPGRAWMAKAGAGLVAMAFVAGTCGAQSTAQTTAAAQGSAEAKVQGPGQSAKQSAGTREAEHSAKPATQEGLAQDPTVEFKRYFAKHPGLLEEFGRIVQKLEKVEYPAGRTQSKLLPLLPAGTVAYAAIPNYGDVAQQALTIFRQEMKESKELKEWWEQGEVGTGGEKVLDAVERFCQINKFLGDEIVVSATMAGKEPSFVLLAQAKKPGLKKFLDETITQIYGKANPGVHVFEPQDLATLLAVLGKQDLIVLVRPDYVVAGVDLKAIRSINERLERATTEFASTPFGQRITDEYKGGVTSLAAADLQRVLHDLPKGTEKDQASFQQTGFADMKYLLWDRKYAGDQTLSQMELSFNGTRHGAAAWLAKAAPLGSLDFASPNAVVVLSLMLASPAQIFDDVKQLAGPSSSQFAAIAGGEKALNLNLKDDLLKLLTGEITLEVQDLAPPMPKWRAMLGVKDAERLQGTLATLLTAAQINPTQDIEGEVTYNTLRIPTGNAVMEVGYAFADGYLVIGSSRAATAEAVRMHKSGESLAKSKKFLAALPPGASPVVSAMVYQDPVALAALAALQFRQFAPGMADFFSQLSGKGTPGIMSIYGEETAIREASKGGNLDVGVVLVTAAIAIPNLLRSRIAANEASAVGSIRTVNTAEVTYVSTYPKLGFARDLATMGEGTERDNPGSEAHAGLLDKPLANESCTATAWCTKSGYQFRLRGVCKEGLCTQYVAVATPVNANTGTRSFCSTSDGVIRYKAGPPLTTGITVSECKSWAPL
jgi:type IV pilus assembly protein PilA